MNWQLPLMLAQATETATDNLEELRARTEAVSLKGATVPDHTLARPEGSTSNPFATEYWFPEQASSFAAEVDFLYMAIFWISLVFFIGIVGVMVYFCIKYRRKGGVIDPQPSTSHNTAIEILWSVLPSILLVWIFYVGAESYFNMRTPREDSEEILVTAEQFGWVFTYPDGDQSSELHLVQGQPTSLVMQSKDVLHSFYVPAFRQKMDIVPGRYTYAYIEPTKVGQYRLSCNEYCGTGHSKMKTMAEVHKTAALRKVNTEWIEAEKPMWQNGEHIYQINCSGCHKVDGTKATGPALNLIWGTKEKLKGGETVPVDRAYIQESILYPNEKIVAGYAAKMNSFKGILDEQDINRVVSYLKYLKAKEDFTGTDEEFLEQHPEFSPKLIEADMEQTVPAAIEGSGQEAAPLVPAETPAVETPVVVPATPVVELEAAPLVPAETPAVEAPVVPATPVLETPAVELEAPPVVTPPVVETTEAPTVAPATPIVEPPAVEAPVAPAVEVPATEVPVPSTEVPVPTTEVVPATEVPVPSTEVPVPTTEVVPTT